MSLTMWRVAWRNLWRHKQRTTLMIATVSVGSLVILVLFGLTDGMMGSMTSTQIDWDQGDFQIRTSAYANDPIPEHALSADQVSAATAALAAVPTTGIAPRLETYGMLRSAHGTAAIVLRGIDPAMESQVTLLDDSVVGGQSVSTDGDILLPARLARDLDVRVGERVVVLAVGGEGTESRAFIVSGLFESPSFAMEQVALATIDDVRGVTGVDGATSLAVGLPNGASAARAVEGARVALAGLEGVEVADYFDSNPFARLMVSGSAVRMVPFVLMISLMAGFGVANTTFYSILERTREFGVMTAVGMNRRLLARTVLIESTIVAAVGFVIGGGIGYGVLVYLSRHGWDLSVLSDMLGSIGFPRIVYASTSGWHWLVALSVVAFTALAAAWYPARRANRLEPVTAIREG